jgi:hypothetical protein
MLYCNNVMNYSIFRTQAIHRILSSRPDFILYSDAGLDSRVFALAHERLAPYQGALWGWGGSLGIPSLDFYITPAVLWTQSKCRSSNKNSEFTLPQELYSEQVVLLEGIPPLPPSYVVKNNSLLANSETNYRDGDRIISRKPVIVEDWNVLEVENYYSILLLLNLL